MLRREIHDVRWYLLSCVPFGCNARSGSGTAAFVGSKVYGGDQSYYYKGSLSIDGASLSGTIEVKRHQQGESIFGPLDHFRLTLSGQETGGKFILNGNVEGQPNLTIRITGTKVAELE